VTSTMSDDANHPPSEPSDDLPNADGAGLSILFSHRQRDHDVDEPGLDRLARATLAGEGIRAGELSVSFVTEEEMADLHVRFMSEGGPTDVLSFPLDDDHGDERGLLGDVVIAPAFAARQALEHGDDPEAELGLLLVHGILHLLGYDHEDDRERRAMWDRQRRYSGVAVR
jgi:probable rRNA maturation factor